MEQQEKYYIEDDEITLKELILKLKEFWNYLLSYWIQIAIVGVLMAALFGLRAKRKPIEYQASLTFMVDDDSGGGGGIGSILSQFGFGARNSEFNLEKILSLSKSMRIINNSIFSKGEVNDKVDFYANHVIEEYELRKNKGWIKEEMEEFSFTHDSIHAFSLAENIATKSLFAKIVGGPKTKNPLFSSSTNEDTGIMTLSAKTTNPELSLGLVKTIFENLSQYYVEKSTEKSVHSYQILKQKTDSIYSVLNAKEYALAKFRDENRGVFLNKIKLKEQQLQTDITALRMAWGEALKNQELANYALKEQTPFIQEIDVPFAPLSPIPNSLLRAIAIGGLLGGFLAVGFLIFRKIIRDAMAS